MVRHCPRCELRFSSEGELAEHLSVDHEADATVFERYRYPGSRPRDPLYPDLAEAEPQRRRVLVVANQTLHSPELEAEVVQRLEAGPADVVVLVPATHSADYPTQAAGTSEASLRPDADEPGLAQARWRLRKTVEALRAAGASVYGELGPADPFEAAGRLLAHEEFDEVIMSTLPRAVSRWLAMDVPTRIQRRFGVPVTVVPVGSGLVTAPSAEWRPGTAPG